MVEQKPLSLEDQILRDPHFAPFLLPPAEAAVLKPAEEASKQHQEEPTRPKEGLMEAAGLLSGDPFIDLRDQLIEEEARSMWEEPGQPPKSEDGWEAFLEKYKNIYFNRSAQTVIPVEYNPQTHYPMGLGTWRSQSPDLEKAYPQTPGEWVKQPKKGKRLILKKPKQASRAYLALERAALLELQNLFPDDASRPVRLYGYGTSEASYYDEQRHQRMALGRVDPYLILEFISPPFQPVGTNQVEQMSLQDALRLSIGILDVVSKTHRAGVTHDDLGLGSDQDTNFFWSSQTGQVRLIDWETSQNSRIPSKYGVDYQFDRGKIGELLFLGVTKQSLGQNQSTPESYLQEVTPEIRRVIERACLVGGANYGHYSSSEGTAQMYIDLMTAYRQFTQQPTDSVRYYQQTLDKQLTRLTLINSYDSLKQNPPTDPALQKIWREIDFNVRAADNDRMAIEKYGSAIAYVLVNAKNGYWSLFDTALNKIYPQGGV